MNNNTIGTTADNTTTTASAPITADNSAATYNKEYQDLLHDEKRFCVEFSDKYVNLVACTNCEPEIEPKPLCPGCSDNLTAFEEELEHKFAHFVQVGSMLQEIKVRRLYRETHSKFSDYYHDLWDKLAARTGELPAINFDVRDHYDLSAEELTELERKAQYNINRILARRQRTSAQSTQGINVAPVNCETETSASRNN